MGFFSSGKRKKKSIGSRINAAKKKLELKKKKEELARLLKSVRGY